MNLLINEGILEEVTFGVEDYSSFAPFLLSDSVVVATTSSNSFRGMGRHSQKRK